MDWTTVRAKNKRNRSGSNDTEQINIAVNVSPNKKRKSYKKSNPQTKIRKLVKVIKVTINQNLGQKPRNTGNDKQAVNKDSVLVVVTDIPENTYFNSIKMANMILGAFPRLKETGLLARYRVNKRHEGKCYVTLPKDHFNDNVTEIINSQLGFEKAKVKVIKAINNVPEKAHKVVAIGVHQTISEDDIKTELANSNITINKVQRLKFNG